ncbi:MAG TPA: ZIP family metal transporter [Candidatus Nanoarchaeia archaeon]|nr:ZIP family metal transporter [Candidatus Nanoarchaeia archaeon]
MAALLYAFLSVVGVSLITMVGLFSFFIKDEYLKKALPFLVAFAVGSLLGDAFIHLIPGAVEELGAGLEVSLLVIGGIIVSFIVEKIIHWRHCHVMYGSIEHCRDHSHHTHFHAHEPLRWMNLIADGVHNFIDGVVIGASYLVSVPVGLATTLAVVFHEVPQELGDFGILMHTGLSKARALWYNFLFGLTSVVGAVLVVVIGKAVEELIPLMLPFAAGSFVYIASSDLIPELQKEVRVQQSVLQLAAFLLGIAIMVMLLLLE